MPLPTDRRPEEAKQKAPMDKDFPVKGLDENWAYKAQPEGTTPACLNVRPYDATGQRLRGGQRAGLSKWIATQPNGTNPIQRMGYLPPQTVGVASQTVPVPVTYGSSLTGSGGVLSDPNFHNVTRSAGLISASGSQPIAGATGIQSTIANPSESGVLLAHNLAGQSFSVSADINISVPVPPLGGGGPTIDIVVVSFYQGLASSNPSVNAGSTQAASVTFRTRNMSVGWGALAGKSDYINFVSGTPGAGATISTPSTTLSTTMKLSYSKSTGLLKFYVGGVLMGTTAPTFSYAVPPSYPGIAMTVAGTLLAGSTASVAASNFQLEEGDLPGSQFSNAQDDGSGGLVYTPFTSSGLLLAVSGGSVYSGYAGNPWLAISGGSGVLSTKLNVVRMAPNFGKMYFVDGTNAGYSIYDPVANTVSSWTAAVAVRGAGTLPTNNPAGPLAPLKTLGATIIARWRGRIVLSGLASDPQNWFMSAAAAETPTSGPAQPDPSLNWNYGELPFSATSPVAGNNSDAGLLGDVITALAPYNDDIMLMGGIQSIWLMRGDPANNGQIDNVTHEVGIIGPDAWCLDSQGTMYFFGGGTFFRMAPFGMSSMYQKVLGGMPEALSQGRLDRIFGQVDATTHEVMLLWDELLKGVHIYITPFDNMTTVHYWWDQRTDSFWPEQTFPNCDPTSVLNFKSSNSVARADLLGSRDGYVRQVDNTSSSDDGNPIASMVRLAPMTAGSTHQNSRINRITTVLDSASDPVTVNVYAAQSPEEAVNATTPAWAYTVSPTNRYGVPRIQGNSILLEIANNAFQNVWQTATAYAIGATITGPDNLLYVCLLAHTGGVFADDLAAGDWVVSGGYTWSLESLNVVSAITGRTRHGRI